jgi:hypothetical protein
MAVIIDGTSGVSSPDYEVDGVTGQVYPIVSGTAVTASGTAVNFTSIPSWVKRITVMLSNVSTSGTSPWLIQLGDSGGIENTGYLGGSGDRGGEGASTAGFQLVYSPAAASAYSGIATITLVDTSNSWVISGVIAINGSGQPKMFAGSKATSATLDRVRITTTGGTDTFDAGSINILYE